YIRTGILLGQLLFDNDVPAWDGSESWVDALLRDPAHRAAIEREVRTVAEEIASDPRYADDGPLAPDEGARDRFRALGRDPSEVLVSWLWLLEPGLLGPPLPCYTIPLPVPNSLRASTRRTVGPVTGLR